MQYPSLSSTILGTAFKKPTVRTMLMHFWNRTAGNEQRDINPRPSTLIGSPHCRKGGDGILSTPFRKSASQLRQGDLEDPTPVAQPDALRGWTRWRTVCKTRHTSEIVDFPRGASPAPMGLRYRVAVRLRGEGRSQATIR